MKSLLCSFFIFLSLLSIKVEAASTFIDFSGLMSLLGLSDRTKDTFDKKKSTIVEQLVVLQRKKTDEELLKESSSDKADPIGGLGEELDNGYTKLLQDLSGRSGSNSNYTEVFQENANKLFKKFRISFLILQAQQDCMNAINAQKSRKKSIIKRIFGSTHCQQQAEKFRTEADKLTQALLPKLKDNLDTVDRKQIDEVLKKYDQCFTYAFGSNKKDKKRLECSNGADDREGKRRYLVLDNQVYLVLQGNNAGDIVKFKQAAIADSAAVTIQGITINATDTDLIRFANQDEDNGSQANQKPDLQIIGQQLKTKFSEMLESRRNLETAAQGSEIRNDDLEIQPADCEEYKEAHRHFNSYIKELTSLIGSEFRKDKKKLDAELKTKCENPENAKKKEDPEWYAREATAILQKHQRIHALENAKNMCLFAIQQDVNGQKDIAGHITGKLKAGQNPKNCKTKAKEDWKAAKTEYEKLPASVKEGTSLTDEDLAQVSKLFAHYESCFKKALSADEHCTDGEAAGRYLSLDSTPPQSEGSVHIGKGMYLILKEKNERFREVANFSTLWPLSKKLDSTSLSPNGEENDDIDAMVAQAELKAKFKLKDHFRESIIPLSLGLLPFKEGDFQDDGVIDDKKSSEPSREHMIKVLKKGRLMCAKAIWEPMEEKTRLAANLAVQASHLAHGIGSLGKGTLNALKLRTPSQHSSSEEKIIDVSSLNRQAAICKRNAYKENLEKQEERYHELVEDDTISAKKFKEKADLLISQYKDCFKEAFGSNIEKGVIKVCSNGYEKTIDGHKRYYSLKNGIYAVELSPIDHSVDPAAKTWEFAHFKYSLGEKKEGEKPEDIKAAEAEIEEIRKFTKEEQQVHLSNSLTISLLALQEQENSEEHNDQEANEIMRLLHNEFYP